MQIQGVSCSARVDRNTADLLNLTLKTLQRKGLDTELIEPANFKILPCQGCNYQCLYHKERDCPIKDDDVPKIWKKLNAANAVIFQSPNVQRNHPVLVENPAQEISGASSTRTAQAASDYWSNNPRLVWTSKRTSRLSTVRYVLPILKTHGIRDGNRLGKSN